MAKMAVGWTTAAVLGAGLLVQFALQTTGLDSTRTTTGVEPAAFTVLIGELQGRGWEPTELTATAMEMQRVTSTLQYDALRHMRLRNDGGEMTLLVAYWSPGRWDPRLVDEHTPAACLPAVGWRTVRRDEYGLGIARRVQHGTFADKGSREIDCYWWHIVGGRKRTYTRSNPLEWWRDAMAMLRAGCGESQMFVRFSVSSCGEDATLTWLAPTLEVLLKHGYIIDDSG